MNTKGEAPWNLKADKLVSIDDGVIVEASGGVLIQRGNDYMKADFARYYTAPTGYSSRAMWKCAWGAISSTPARLSSTSIPAWAG
ncbi:MAG: hypothetical protein IKL01_00830 [Mailhella sp.]|nr:hypothetical protein [Mailhella sp.]